jgi:hypothetical protein
MDIKIRQSTQDELDTRVSLERAKDMDINAAMAQQGGPYNPTAGLLEWVKGELEKFVKDMDDGSEKNRAIVLETKGVDTSKVNIRQYHRGMAGGMRAAETRMRATLNDLLASMDALAKKLPGPTLILALCLAPGLIGCRNINLAVVSIVHEQDSCYVKVVERDSAGKSTRVGYDKSICDGPGHDVESNVPFLDF